MTGISLGLAAAALGCLVMAIGVDPSAAQQDQGSQGPTQGPTLSHGKNAQAGTDGSSQTRSTQNGSPESGSDIKVQTAQVGAGTVDDVTTGSSGPKKKSSSGPTSPEASLCNSYDGAV